MILVLDAWRRQKAPFQVVLDGVGGTIGTDEDNDVGLADSADPYLPISACHVVAAAVNSTVVAGENLTVGSTVWLPAESIAPGR